MFRLKMSYLSKHFILLVKSDAKWILRKTIVFFVRDLKSLRNTNVMGGILQLFPIWTEFIYWKKISKITLLNNLRKHFETISLFISTVLVKYNCIKIVQHCFDIRNIAENNFSSNFNLLSSSKQTSCSLVDRWRLTTH